MEFANSETRKNLARSFAGEAQARTRYTIYAQQARQEDKELIARVFEETAANETVHAQEFLKLLQKLGGCSENLDIEAGYPYPLGDTRQNLGFAARGELEEHTSVYPAFAELARREGFPEAAQLWNLIGKIEGEHQRRFDSLEAQLCQGTRTKKQTPVVWKCLNCGHTYESKEAALKCPVCGKGAGWQQEICPDKW